MAETVTKNEICPSCGVDVRPNSMFCYNCGGDISASESSFAEKERSLAVESKPAVEESVKTAKLNSFPIKIKLRK